MRIDALPPAIEIDHPVILPAAEEYEAAKRQLSAKRREIRDLEAKRRPSGILPLSALKELEKLENQVETASLAVSRAYSALQKVLDEHAESWVASLASRAEDLDRLWDEAVAALVTLHSQRAVLDAQRGKLGADVKAIGFIRLKPAQLTDSLTGDKLPIAFDPDPTARQRRRALIPVGDVLGALADLGAPPEPVAAANSGLAEAFKQAYRHAQTVNRGYSTEEAHSSAVTVGGHTASVYVPGSGGGDD